MMKTTSASNLLDAIISPAIGAEIEEGCPQSLPEKRRHAETGDGCPPPPMEKRNCVEEPTFEYFPATGEGRRRVGKGFYKIPAYAQERYLKVMERFGADWERLRMYEHRSSDKQIGKNTSLFDDDENQTSQGDGEMDYPKFKPLLNFKENPELYNEFRGFAEKTVTYFNDNNNQKLCFEDIEMVASCQTCYHHYQLTIKAIDPLDATSVMVLRSKVLNGRVQCCELVPLDAY